MLFPASIFSDLCYFLLLHYFDLLISLNEFYVVTFVLLKEVFLNALFPDVYLSSLDRLQN